MTPQEFISKIGEYARQDMQKTGILASLTIAQAILESGWGKSGLTVVANNLFGYKGKYNGQGYVCKTFEYYNGAKTQINAEFRKYPSWLESIADHSTLFLRLNRYANLRGCKDYKQACINVQADGYATAPTYANSLIKLIEQYKLYEYDNVTVTPPCPPATPQPLTITINDMVKIKPTATQWAKTVTFIPSFARTKVYKVAQVDGDKVLLAQINSWVYIRDIERA